MKQNHSLVPRSDCGIPSSRLRRQCVPLVCLAVYFAAIHPGITVGQERTAVQTDAKKSAPAKETAVGNIAGVVTYTADPNRPWRYTRYYVKWPSKGQLAEAVVALRARELAAVAPKNPATVVMNQVDYRFVPETIAIRASDQVKFTNGDVTVHNVRTDDGDRPFNVNTPMGGEYTHRFESAGGTRRPIRIGCTYHGQMRAWIYVFPHSFFQVTGEDGKFLIQNIPVGEYELEMVHPAGDLRARQRVAVKAGETATADFKVSPDHLAETKP